MRLMTGVEAARSFYEVARHIQGSSQINQQIKNILIKSLQNQAQIVFEAGNAQVDHDAWVASAFIALFKREEQTNGKKE